MWLSALKALFYKAYTPKSEIKKSQVKHQTILDIL